MNLLGAILLALSFVATGSDLIAVTGYAPSGSPPYSYEPYTALCAGDKLIFQQFKNLNGNTNLAGTRPKGDTERPMAVVTRESQRFFLLGSGLVVLSTIWQASIGLRSSKNELT